MTKLTGRNLARHVLAYVIASLSVGLFILAVPVIIEIFTQFDTFDKPGLINFVLGMGLFMGLFYATFAGPFVLVGIALGLWFDRREWWFCTLWGMLCALATAALFHDRGQNLDAYFYLAVAVAGFLAGLVYWRIAVGNAKTSSNGPPPTMSSQ